NLPAARRIIAGHQLDILFYTDIGMEPFSYTLGFSRLAPIQCVGWGHPVTTGSKAIDYYLSSDLFESTEADQHYTEQLVRLKNLPTYYYRPTPRYPVRGREYFGLPHGARLYGCPQSIYKFHPDFDELLAGILRADSSAILVLLHSRFQHLEELLL